MDLPTERSTWQGRPTLLTWLPGDWPPSDETVSQVSGVCLTGEGRIVLVSQDGTGWSLPGGKPEDGESWEQTLRREVAEEACAEVLHFHLLGAQRVEGLTPQPFFQLQYWARVRLHPFRPEYETRHRRAVPPQEVAQVLPWGTGPIGRALLAAALAHDEASRGQR